MSLPLIYACWPQHIPPHQWGCTACNGMSIGRKAGLQAAQVLAATGLDLITKPELLTAAKAEFQQRTAGTKYKSMNVLDACPGGIMDRGYRHHYECCIHAAMEHFGIEEPVR